MGLKKRVALRMGKDRGGKKAKLRKNNGRSEMRRWSSRREKTTEWEKEGKAHSRGEEKNKSPNCFAGQLKGLPKPHCSPNSQRWISKIIPTEHKFADCGSVESPWTSSALLNITRNLSIITEGLLSTRPNCSNNFNYFPWQILCFMYFSGLIIMISLISRYWA